jgi:hypothetical protein
MPVSISQEISEPHDLDLRLRLLFAPRETGSVAVT